MPTRHDRSGTTLQEIQRHFAEFAQEYSTLRLYHRIAEGMSRDDLAGLLLAAPAGQARPVLFLAALHELVLRRPETAGAQWYPSVTGADQVPNGDPWPDVRATISAHQGELAETIAARTTQTNEVNRATYVAALLHQATRDLPEVPIALVELGSSAGLLLGIDRFRVEVGSARTGPASSPVYCHADDRGRVPLSAVHFPPIATSIGVDLAPVSLTDPDEVRWLEACLWPDLPERLDRFRTAVGLARQHPPVLVRSDLVEGCAAAITRALAAAPSAHVVVLTSWALTYVDPARRDQLAQVLSSVGTQGVPVSWTGAEPTGCMPGLPRASESPGTTVLGLRSWRAGREQPARRLGTSHPHGAWVALSPESGA